MVKPGDLAHLIDDMVECLDLSAIEAVYEAELRAASPYHPVMMTNRVRRNVGRNPQ
jgi:transposase